MNVRSHDGSMLDIVMQGPEDAPPVLLLHGVSSNRSTYDWLPDAVTTGRCIIRADYRGHGGSAAAPGSQS